MRAVEVRGQRQRSGDDVDLLSRGYAGQFGQAIVAKPVWRSFRESAVRVLGVIHTDKHIGVRSPVRYPRQARHISN